MITDKNGTEVALQDILNDLVGTDDLDQTKAVIDFSIYPVHEGKNLGDPTYYFVAANAIVTQISFMGAFTLVEVDFRNIGIQLLQQVVTAVNRYHTDVNTTDVIMLSTITSLNRSATHIMTLANPLICVRGFSEDGQGSTLLQLVYATDNVGFSVSQINYDEIDADLDREMADIESAAVSEDIIAAGSETEETESEMQQIFKPDFIPDFEEHTDEDKSIRVTGYSRKDLQVGRSDTSRIKGVREVEDTK